MILQKGNRKLPNTTLIFNLPAGKTCPASTEDCRKWCYAKKAERIYPQVLPHRERNLDLTKDKEFVNIITQDLATINNWDTVRIHESGDFYNPSYHNNWFKIANNFPDKIFYAYTKTRYGNIFKPKNFILIYSDDDKDETIESLKDMHFSGRARVNDGRKLTKKEFMCPGSCKTCNYCYTTGFKQVVFNKH